MKKYLKLLLFLLVLSSFRASSQKVAVELEKMNILYIGVDIPLKIVVENYPCNKIIVKATYGSIKPSLDNCQFLYKIDSCNANIETIFVGIQIKGTIKWIDSLKYRVTKTPQPQISFYGIDSDWINSRDRFSHIIAHINDFDYEYDPEVVNYSIEILRNDTFIIKLLF